MGGDAEDTLQRTAPADTEAGTPVSIETAFRRVRWLAGALVLLRLWSTGSLPPLAIIGLVGAFWSINAVSFVAQHKSARVRALLGVVQLLADTVIVLLVVWAQHGHTGVDSADWAVLVLPVIEGAMRFKIPGAVVSWLALAVAYIAWDIAVASGPSASVLAQRLTLVFLVALPIGFLAQHLAEEMQAHREARGVAEQRSALLRAAALGGERSSRLDVDEILDVLRNTVMEMGFSSPQVFELSGSDTATLSARPVRQSRDVLAIPPGDHRLLAAAAARQTGKPTVWPPGAGRTDLSRKERRRRQGDDRTPFSMLFALPITTVDDALVVVVARWPGPAAPPASHSESLTLFAAQAGASLRNAQVHRELAALKDRLAHEASHDPLTGLPNLRRFTERLEETCSRSRPGVLIGTLFLDLDGFKDVNDRWGHDAGNELLVAAASRLRSCVRPGDIVARVGGDEFTIMLTRLESVAPAVEVAERICTALTEPFDLRSHPVRISASIGIAVSAADGADPGDLLRRADVAMYRAKSQGKAGWAMDPSSLEPAANGGAADA